MAQMLVSPDFSRAVSRGEPVQRCAAAWQAHGLHSGCFCCGLALSNAQLCWPRHCFAPSCPLTAHLLLLCFHLPHRKPS